MAFDSTLGTTLSTALGDWKTDMIAEFGVVLPIALGLVITISIAFAVIRYFRGLTNL